MKRIRKVGLVLLVSYTILLIYLMFFGFDRYTFPEFRYNLVLFSTLRSLLNFNQFNTKTWIINLIGNIGVFVPFGILFPIVLRGSIIQLYIKFITGIFFLELIQLLSRRGVFDVDDLLLNSVGFIIGYVSYRIITMYIDKYNKRRNKDG